MEKYELEFDGYWSESFDFEKIPDKAGIYCVYSYLVDEHDPVNLIYVGESENVASRISSHEQKGEWESWKEEGQALCISFAPVSDDEARKRAEAAIIHFHNPPLNEEFILKFPFDETQIKISGEHAKLEGDFTVPFNKITDYTKLV